MAYTPAIVANTFLSLSREARQTVDPMKMQKLVYFAQGWHLGLGNGPLINEPIEAWDYGPVVASLYRELRPYGAGQIVDPIREIAPKPTGGFAMVSREVDDESGIAFMRRILEVYGKFSALQLSEMTHQPNTPWSMVRAKFPGLRAAVIPDEMMTSYFKQLAQQNAERANVAARV
jgi:uncharacterized phage-associated protein